MHAPLGQAFQACVEHVLSAGASFRVFDIHADDDVSAWVQKLVAFYREKPDAPVLILCDVVGATPFNIARLAQAAMAQEGGQADVIVGANLGMVLKSVCDRQTAPEQFVDAVKQSAGKAIAVFNADLDKDKI
ncbi:PTS sugar transporter subunit IIA [Paenalcaligenes sp. Me131]|uniref:PTS sugar transporter subunit IIA n=1 Tax=Paenalcaligenes sp. Me131 TaxID=3392636 RepID=UPI003D2B310F